MSKLYKLGLYTNNISFNYYKSLTYNKQVLWFLNYNYQLNILRLNNSYYENNYPTKNTLLNINDYLIKNNLDLLTYPNICLYYINRDDFNIYNSIHREFIKRANEMNIKLK